MTIRKNPKIKSNFTLKHFFQDSSSIAVLILLVTSYYIFFWKLGEGGIRQWDESSLAVNALEMLLNGNPIVKYLGGEVDLINTKPPLVIWFIVVFMKIFGYTEFALRLPLAMCAVATVLLIYIFSRHYLKDSLAAFIGSLALITSIGFTGEHVARTGDYDAMLVLWMTTYSLAYFLFLETKEEIQKGLFLNITTAALILAVWTKGIAGLLVLPSLFIYTFYKKKIVHLLLSPRIYYSTLIFIILSLSYYFLRESFSPGFLKAVVENELTGRYMKVVPGGMKLGFFYYLERIVSYRFLPWIYLLPICFIAAYTKQIKIIRNFSVFGFIYIISYFSIISYSKSKFEWYDAPLYPIAALIIGLGLSVILKILIKLLILKQKNSQSKRPLKAKIISSLILIVLLFPPYLFNLNEVRKGIPFRLNDRAVTEVAIRYRDYFKELSVNTIGYQSANLIVFNPIRYNLPLLYYTQLAQSTTPSLSLSLAWKESTPLAFSSGNVVINCSSDVDKDLKEQYSVITLHHSNLCETIVIEAEKT